MNNIISSDLFRLRHGVALRNSFLGLLAVVVIVVITVALSQSEGLGVMVLDQNNMTPAEIAELQQDLQEASEETANIQGGAAIGTEMLSQSASLLFFLPIILAVFCADFSAGTYRNTLSYESNRRRVYLAKFLLSCVLCVAMMLAMLVFSWLLGGVVFGFGDFSVSYFTSTAVTLLLQLPIFLSTVAVGHCLVAFTKKSSTTIAVFLIGFLALGIGLQLLAASFPALDWLLLLDPQSAGKIMVQRAMHTQPEIAIVLVYHAIIAVGATVLGAFHFSRTDMP